MNRIEIALAVALFSLMVISVANFVSTSGQMGSHALQIADLTKSFEDYKADSTAKYEAVLKLCNKDEDELEGFGGRVSLLEKISEKHERELIRLGNGTSNADVLDELKKVRHHVDESMQTTLSTVEEEVDQLRDNTTEQLQISRDEMDHISERVNGVIDKATRHMRQMEDAVTYQLSNTSSALNFTLETVNSIVSHAKDNIHTQVKDIQSKINSYVAFSNKQFAAENDFVKYQLAGTFTLLACLISLYHITQHQRNYAKPEIQRRIMAIIWMVPVYSMSSWLSMVSGPANERVFETLQQFYEAYVVYTFFGMLIAVMEEGKGLNHLIERITLHVEEEQHAVVHAQRLGKPLPVEHIRPPFPVCYEYDSSVRIAITWLYQCKLLVMQFVLLKPVYTLLPFVLTSCGVDYYHIPMSNAASDMEDPGEAYFHQINWRSPHLYMLIFENLSVSLAFYGLLCFFHGTEKELAWCNPWPKFVCIKAIVFMTFWQGLCINMMSTLGMVDEKAASQIQNLLVCIEMLIASLALIYVFPFQEWQEGFKRDKQIMLKDTLAFRDFMKDVKQMVTRWSMSNVGSPMPDYDDEAKRFSVLNQSQNADMRQNQGIEGRRSSRAPGPSGGLSMAPTMDSGMGAHSGAWGGSGNVPKTANEASPLLAGGVRGYGLDVDGVEEGSAPRQERLNSTYSEFESLCAEDDYSVPADTESAGGIVMTRTGSRSSSGPVTPVSPLNLFDV